MDGLNERRGGAHHQYLTPEQEAFIKDIVLHAHPADCNYSEVTWSGWLLVDLIKNMYSKEYTREGVYALLKRMGVSYKKANKIDPKKSLKVINEWKQQMEKKLKNIDLENCEILYQDESAFVSDVSQYNWSLKGTTALFKGYRYGTRINCFGTFDIKKAKLILTQEKKGNSETMVISIYTNIFYLKACYLGVYRRGLASVPSAPLVRKVSFIFSIISILSKGSGGVVIS